MDRGHFYDSISDSLWRLTEIIPVDTQRAVQIKHFHLPCEMALLCCPALVLPDGLFFGNVDKAVHFPKAPVSWWGLRRKPHRVCPPDIELTRKAARESDNFIWDLMCWDKAPVRSRSLRGEQSLHIRKWAKWHAALPCELGGGGGQCIQEAPGQMLRSDRKRDSIRAGPAPWPAWWW